jgi:hypothetical protein
MTSDRPIITPHPHEFGVCSAEPPTLLEMQELEDADHRFYVRAYGNPIVNYLLDSEDRTYYDLVLSLDQANLSRRRGPCICEALPEYFAMEDKGARLTYTELAFARGALRDGELRLSEKEAHIAKLTRSLEKWQERVNQLKNSD